jgi:TolB-like protein/Tfp pilus assembly protein PilF
MSLLTELKRRNVHRAAVFYAGAAWLLVQVATQVFPFFHIDESLVRAVVIACVIGFPFALLFSWFYEWTPQGIKLESEIDRGASVTSAAGKRMDRRFDKIIIAVLSLAVILLLTNTFVGNKAASAGLDKSIAVLPLVNESGDPDNEYFSDGLSEELITALAQIGDLKVIGRSSSFRFKGGKETSQRIGELLGVATLLEGTVRRQGDRVRIVAELISTADGRALWSRSFDRQLADVFAVQQEIAGAVAASLKSTLLGASHKAEVAMASSNVEAHNAYLLGHFYWLRRGETDFQKAVDQFNEAIRLDPAYAQAYVERSTALIALVDVAGSTHPRELIAGAMRDALKAVELAPDLAEARTALGWALFLNDWKFEQGLAEVERAAQLEPGNPRVQSLLSRLLTYVGRFDAAVEAAQSAITSDPLQFSPRNTLARALFTAGRLEEADAAARKGAELQPGASASHRWQVSIAVLRGDAEAALREARLEPEGTFGRFLLALALSVHGDRAEADAALADLIAKDSGNAAYQIAQIYAWRGETDTAFEWLQRAYDLHDNGILSLPGDPMLKMLRADPRYQALVAKLGLPFAGR